MPRPTTRENSSLVQFKRRTPLDIISRARGEVVLVELPAFKGETASTATVTIGQFVKFSLRTRDPEIGKFRNGAANTQFDKAFASFRAEFSTLSLRTYPVGA